MKLSNSSEPALPSLALKKITNPYQNYETQFDVEKLDLAKMKRIETRILKFDQNLGCDHPPTMERLVEILKATNQPEKLAIICKEYEWLSDRGLGYISESIKRLNTLKEIKLEFAE